jgi:hypothetical protein
LLLLLLLLLLPPPPPPPLLPSMFFPLLVCELSRPCVQVRCSQSAA